jgi:hypothetical protein
LLPAFCPLNSFSVALYHYHKDLSSSLAEGLRSTLKCTSRKKLFNDVLGGDNLKLTSLERLPELQSTAIHNLGNA